MSAIISHSNSGFRSLGLAHCYVANCGIVMLVAYFDESCGHPQGGGETLQVSLGGCLAPKEAWENFEPEWAAALPSGMDMFHMTDFQARKDICRDWDQERRNEFLNTLLDIMGRHVTQFFGFSANVDFDDVWRKKRFREGYRDGLVSSIFEITGVAKALGENKISLIFSDQRDFKLRAIEDILGEIDHQDTRLVSVAMENPRDVNPLQAADIVAYETMRFHKKQAECGFENARYPLRCLGEYGKGMALEWALNSQQRQGFDARLRFSARNAFAKDQSEL
jgi:hypothetical protein